MSKKRVNQMKDQTEDEQLRRCVRELEPRRHGRADDGADGTDRDRRDARDVEGPQDELDRRVASLVLLAWA